MAEKIIYTAKWVRRLVVGFWSTVIGMAMSLLGFTSCLGGYPWFPAPAYGCPVNDFQVSGTVRDATSDTAVPGILVSLYYDEARTLKITDCTADLSGEYLAEAEFGCGYFETLYIKTEDIDGTANGEYHSSDDTVEFSSSDWDETDKQYEVTKDLDINLDL
jgi:putative lipoprotein (rSAM/lipoprotein system)